MLISFLVTSLAPIIYEISNAIGALAAILRYGVHNSNGIVTIKEEIDWMNQYLTLQKIRLKNSFQSEISVEPGIEPARIHKMLLQPFVENAIIHGFEGAQRCGRRRKTPMKPRASRSIARKR